MRSISERSAPDYRGEGEYLRITRLGRGIRIYNVAEKCIDLDSKIYDFGSPVPTPVAVNLTVYLFRFHSAGFRYFQGSSGLCSVRSASIDPYCYSRIFAALYHGARCQRPSSRGADWRCGQQ